MGKILVVYYSRTGSTKKVGDLIAKYLNADVEEIIDTKNRKGFINFILSGKDAMKEIPTNIQTPKYNPSDYDHIIIGSPIWASKMSTPTLTYLHKFKESFKNTSFFFTLGGKPNKKIFLQLKNKLNTKKIDPLFINGENLRDGLYVAKIDDFIKKVQHP